MWRDAQRSEQKKKKNEWNIWVHLERRYHCSHIKYPIKSKVIPIQYLFLAFVFAFLSQALALTHLHICKWIQRYASLFYFLSSSFSWFSLALLRSSSQSISHFTQATHNTQHSNTKCRTNNRNFTRISRQINKRRTKGTAHFRSSIAPF